MALVIFNWWDLRAGHLKFYSVLCLCDETCTFVEQKSIMGKVRGALHTHTAALFTVLTI